MRLKVVDDNCAPETVPEIAALTRLPPPMSMTTGPEMLLPVWVAIHDLTGDHCFLNEALELLEEVVGAGQDSLPAQIAVIDCATVPDIAVLLVATSENTTVPVLVMVFPPEGARTMRVQIMLTALPEIEPLIELVTIVPPVGAVNWTVPEIDEPV